MHSYSEYISTFIVSAVVLSRTVRLLPESVRLKTKGKMTPETGLTSNEHAYESSYHTIKRFKNLRIVLGLGTWDESCVRQESSGST